MFSLKRTKTTLFALRKTLLAIYRTVCAGLKRDFAFIAAVRANNFSVVSFPEAIVPPVPVVVALMMVEALKIRPAALRLAD
jgi:hypothetical protein